jgi:hypothetical protein
MHAIALALQLVVVTNTTPRRGRRPPATGKVADLVVLDANPLLDIANVRKVHAVVANGRAFDRAALEAMVTAAKVRRP